MCGIVGIITKDKTLQTNRLVQQMLEAIKHRGPNQKDMFQKDNITLGMIRLSIIDQQEHQIPYESFDGRAVLVYNGEIYNHEEIRRTHLSKYPFKTKSDAETILYHYLHKGTGSFLDYNGMYAFALYDVDKKELYIVRDRAGEKPLYYINTESFFAFASEIKALFKLIEPVFNPECLSFDAYEFNTGEITMFKNVMNLMPGEYLKVDGLGNVKKYAYWKIWDNLIHVPDNVSKIESRLTDLVVDAIMLRKKNCVHRFGVFVSGGVDSALVACIAKPDYLYTCHYALEDYDELEYAQLVAEKLKKTLVIIRPKREDFERTRRKIIYHLDTPCTWTSFSLWLLLERAHKDIKVVLSGDGADELFGGYHRYHLLHHDEQIKNLKALERYSYLIQRYYGSPVERYVRLVNRCRNRYDVKILRYLEETIGYYFSKMKNDYIHGMGLTDFYTTMQELLQFADRLNMAFGVENRSPFLDYRLIQFAFSLPSKYKIRDGTTKWILKRIARKFIPKKIVERVDKRGFSAPINRWFGWGKNGKYDRSDFKELIYNDWRKVFKVKKIA